MHARLNEIYEDLSRVGLLSPRHGRNLLRRMAGLLMHYERTSGWLEKRTGTRCERRDHEDRKLRLENDQTRDQDEVMIKKAEQVTGPPLMARPGNGRRPR